MPGATQGISFSRAELDNVRVTVFLVLLLASLYSFLACAAFIAIYSLSISGLRSLPNKLNLAAVILMFTLTTVYTLVQLLQLWAIFDLFDLEGGGSRSRLSFDLNITYQGTTLLFAVFGANVIIGDSIILWRAIVIWSWQKRVLYPSLLLLCASIVSWVLADIAVNLSVISTAASLALSLWATTLVSIKAWQRRRLLRKKVAILSRRNALESVFNILTESGIIFTLLWTVYLIGSLTVAGDVVGQIMTIVMAVATPLYPTMIVILVAQNKTPISNQLTTIEPMTVMEPESSDLLGQDTDLDKEDTMVFDSV
ncbi:unnamed protein product [Peniophora sp. CBMAI 1063]|nr:unnamed protein product [Peniophora sp. CBMAI 1063]